ncbi:MAG: hypothetical protein GEU75_17005 [Dehalococcoidia bacterium]|nr:hypothetical protein [Dehalococcoidia bacterium]
MTIQDRAGDSETGAQRRLRRFEVKLVPSSERLSAEELRRREADLERLIIKAACLRAARLAGRLDPRSGERDQSASESA